MPGARSTFSIALSNVKRQLKTGKTRGQNPRDLDPDEISALKERRDTLQAEMRRTAKERAVARINGHTAMEADRVIQAAQQSFAPAIAYFEAIGGAGSSTDLILQGRTLVERGKQKERLAKRQEAEARRAAAKAEKERQRAQQKAERKVGKTILMNGKRPLPADDGTEQRGTADVARRGQAGRALVRKGGGKVADAGAPQPPPPATRAFAPRTGLLKRRCTSATIDGISDNDSVSGETEAGPKAPASSWSDEATSRADAATPETASDEEARDRPCEAPSQDHLEHVRAERCVCPAVSESTCGPAGPDGKPLFARLPEFVALYLVFASGTLARMGEPDHLERYLAELHELNPQMAKAYKQVSHCTASFLTDTTTLKLIQRWLADGESARGALLSGITEATLYNVVIGQSVLPSWRRLEALGPFDVAAPPSPAKFAKLFRAKFPGEKAVVPSHLKQGVLNLLGAGPEVKTVGRFIHELAGKIPAALTRIRRGEVMAALKEDLGLPRFRALLVARLLSVVSPSCYDLNSRDIGDYAELGLWLLLGLPPPQARAAVAGGWSAPAVDPFFAKLIEALTAALAAKDKHGLVGRLQALGLLPLCAQNIEHMLCEWRKMALSEGWRARGDPYEGYAELWRAVAPIIARRAAL